MSSFIFTSEILILRLNIYTHVLTCYALGLSNTVCITKEVSCIYFFLKYLLLQLNKQVV